MTDQQPQHLVELRQTYQRRLHVLELQAATFGLSAPPHVLTEIEDIREKIEAINEQLKVICKQLADSDSPTLQARTDVQLSKLRLIFDERFNEGELRTFCFDLDGVDYDSLPGSGKGEKARELVDFFKRRDKIPNLVKTLIQKRPDISIDDITSQ